METWMIVLICISAVPVILIIIGVICKPFSIYKHKLQERNPLEGKRVRFVEDVTDADNADGVKGHLEAYEELKYKRNFYDRFWKRIFDAVLSFFGMVLLSPGYLIISIAILIDDPGPIIFSQKRVGINKQYFSLHKFRTMKMCTPHDVPTHMLENPEQYITKVGRFLRKSSLDELPQIFDIFIGNMSVIGPRPALWNQEYLIAERDKWNANEVRPGLTGWAQINGRDELPIEKKALLDKEYVDNISFAFDFKCFFMTITNVIRGDGIAEGKAGGKD